MQRIIVDITPGFRMPTIHFSQGDVGTQFAVDLRSRFGDSLPASPTVTIQATKPSGFGFTESATSFTNGVAVFTTTADMTDEAGRFPVEIKVVKDSVTLFSANFYMDGEATTHPDGTIDGQQEQVIPELTQLVERVETAASSVLDMTVEAETLAAGSQATYSYDEDTNTATFGIPQGEAGAGAAGVTASAYSSSKTYAVGDYVIHNSNLYRCTTAITTAESFTAAHWTQVVLADDVSDLKSDLRNLGVNGNIFVPIVYNWQDGYIDENGLIRESQLSQFALISLSKDQTITVGTRNNNVTVISSTNADSVAVGDSVTIINKTGAADVYAEFLYTAKDDINIVICVRKSEYNVLVTEPSLLKDVANQMAYFEDGLDEIEKNITWSAGWVQRNDGKIYSSSASQFALVSMTAGQVVKVGTKNNNTCIIGSTTANSVSVGDTVTQIKVTSSGDTDYMVHTFAAEYDMNIVICVLKSEYDVKFFEKSNIGSQAEKVPAMDSAFTKGFYEKYVVENGSFGAAGLTYGNTNRIRTALIPFTAGTRIVISNGSLSHACGMWKNEVTSANNVRNDDAFITTDETIVPSYDGYIAVVFRNSSNTALIPSDFDGCIKIYPPFFGNIENVLHKLNCARHVPRNRIAPVTILHLSDIHGNSVTLDQIVSQSAYYDEKVDDIICTGDLVYDTAETIASWWNEKVLTCIGNHDTAAAVEGVGADWTALSMADRDAYYIAPFESNWNITHTSGTSYYYKDYTASKVRMIVMDAMLYNDNGEEAATQTTWLANLLADAITNNLHVLIAIHSPHGGATSVHCSFSELGIETMPTYSDCNTPQVVIDTVATAINNGLHFIGYICGHTHRDTIWDAENDGTQLMYCIICGMNSPMNTDLYRGANNNAYNLVTIDTANTLVKIVRGGGADIDNYMRTREAICFNYSTGEKIGEVL